MVGPDDSSAMMTVERREARGATSECSMDSVGQREAVISRRDDGLGIKCRQEEVVPGIDCLKER